MKPLILTLSLLLAGVVAQAQTDTLIQVQDSLVSKVQLKELDSLEQNFMLKSDSIKKSYADQKQKITSLKSRYLLKIDSLKSRKPSQPDNPFDTLKTTTDIKAYRQKLDSLDQELITVQQRTTARMDSLKGKVTSQLGKLKLPKQANGKVAGLTSKMDQVGVPSFDNDISDKLNIPTVNTTLPSLPMGSPQTTIPGTDLLNVNTNLPGTDVNAPDLKNGLPQTNLNTGKLNEITDQAGDIQKQVKEATGSQEGLGKVAETKASEQIEGLPQQKLPDVPGLPGGVPKTGEEAKQQLLDQAKKEAVNHFAGKEQVLVSAMQKMGKYKQKYNSVNSLKDVQDGKPSNTMRGRPLRERIVPAITLQFQSWHDLMLDLNPSIGYKLNSHMIVGLGWNQRIAFNIPDRSFNRYSNIHGLRSYGEYNLRKGFGLRIDLECMNTPLKQRVITDTPPQRVWAWSAMVGIKQKYPIYKKLKGNAQLMYNLFDKDHRSPYTDRLNWRVGLEFSFKKKKKETT